MRRYRFDMIAILVLILLVTAPIVASVKLRGGVNSLTLQELRGHADRYVGQTVRIEGIMIDDTTIGVLAVTPTIGDPTAETRHYRVFDQHDLSGPGHTRYPDMDAGLRVAYLVAKGTTDLPQMKTWELTGDWTYSADNGFYELRLHSAKVVK